MGDEGRTRSGAAGGGDWTCFCGEPHDRGFINGERRELSCRSAAQRGGGCHLMPRDFAASSSRFPSFLVRVLDLAT